MAGISPPSSSRGITLTGIVGVSLTATAADMALAIPAGYDHLVVRLLMRTTKAAVAQDIVNVRFNADTTAVYDLQMGQMNNASDTPTRAVGANQLACFVAPNDQATANRFATAKLEINDYAATDKDKGVLFECGMFHATALTDGIHNRGYGLWRPATPAAITSIQVFPNTATGFKAGSKMVVHAFTNAT